MFLTPMLYQGIVGIFAGLSQAFQFFQRYRKVASGRPLKLSPSIRQDANRVPVVGQQLGTPFAAHRAHKKDAPFVGRAAGRLAHVQLDMMYSLQCVKVPRKTSHIRVYLGTWYRWQAWQFRHVGTVHGAPGTKSAPSVDISGALRGACGGN
jgi:hypothetical protein